MCRGETKRIRNGYRRGVAVAGRHGARNCRIPRHPLWRTCLHLVHNHGHVSSARPRAFQIAPADRLVRIDRLLDRSRLLVLESAAPQKAPGNPDRTRQHRSDGLARFRTARWRSVSPTWLYRRGDRPRWRRRRIECQGRCVTASSASAGCRVKGACSASLFPGACFTARSVVQSGDFATKVPPNKSFKRAAVTGCATIVRYAAAAA